MSEGGSLPPGVLRRPRLVPATGLAGDVASFSVPAAPADLRLRRAAELVEEVAFELAGRATPQEVSRLIEIAAELDRLARRKIVPTATADGSK